MEGVGYLMDTCWQLRGFFGAFKLRLLKFLGRCEAVDRLGGSDSSKSEIDEIDRLMSIFFQISNVVFAVAAIGTLNLRSHRFLLLEAIFATGKLTRPIWLWYIDFHYIDEACRPA